jgi:hypothetical protein
MMLLQPERPARPRLVGLGDGSNIPEANIRLFRGWQVNPNSIFCEGVRLRRPTPETAHGCPVLLSSVK